MQRFFRATAACVALSSSIVAVAAGVELDRSAHALSAVDTLSDNPADGYTLREAITDANAMIGPDDIVFAQGLDGASRRIELESRCRRQQGKRNRRAT